jgi:hypothetical protein
MTHTQSERLAREISEHKGEWVLVRGTRVVAAAPSIKTAISQIPKKDRARVRAQFCPEEDLLGSSFSAF